MPDLEAASIVLQHRDRIREVLDVFAKYGLAEVAEQPGDTIPGFAIVRSFVAAKVDKKTAAMAPGARLRAALGELGTAWIKFGQSLSTRPDLVGPSVAAELEELQSAAPADAQGEALATIEEELGAPVRDLYGSFHRLVTASASVAEVHKATLKDHTPVVVKVIHHGAAQRVRDDLAVMRVLAEKLEHDEEIARYRPVALVEDFADMLAEALDLRNEAKNLILFRRNFADDEGVLIPEPYTALSSGSVLTMTRESGRTMSDRASIERAGWDVDELLEKAADVYLKMIFRDGIFHADPHQGNFLLAKDHKLAILDFGDVGRVTPTRREQLARLALSLVAKDNASFADTVLEFVSPPPGTDLRALRGALADWVDSSLGGGIGQLDVPEIVSTFLALMRSYRLVVPSDMALLGRTLMRLQGLAQAVGADLDLISLIAPYAVDIVKENLSPKRLLRGGARTARKWSQFIEELPDELSATLAELREGKVAIEFRLRDDDRIADRLVGGMVVASSLLAASQLASRRTPPALRGVSVPAIAALAIGVLTWYRGRRSGAQKKSIVSVAADLIRRRT